jgi:uncharacterized protein YciI
MSWYLVELRYLPDRIAQVRPSHRRYMASLVEQGLVAFAGRYSDESAGLFLYRADNEHELQRLIDEDPYYSEGATSSRSVRPFSPVVATGLPLTFHDPAS